MISLNGVPLSENLFWDNEFSEALIAEDYTRTILGTSIRTTSPIIGGRTIILKATRSGAFIQGYFSKAQILQFRQLEQSGQTVLFGYEGQIINVVVKAGGVNMKPHIERPNASDTDLYSGTLILKEV